MYMPTMLGDQKFETKFAWLPTRINRTFIWFKSYRVTYEWSETFSGGRDWIVRKRELINTDINSDIDDEGSYA